MDQLDLGPIASYMVCAVKIIKKNLHEQSAQNAHNIYTAFELGIIKIIKLKWCKKNIIRSSESGYQIFVILGQISRMGNTNYCSIV